MKLMDDATIIYQISTGDISEDEKMILPQPKGRGIKA